MANITVTHTFVNGTTADATEVNTNFTDIINGTSDGTKDFSISALTVAGTANFSGAVNLNGNTTVGNATTDTITFTGRVASDIDPDTTATYSFGSTSLTYKDLYLDNGATDGGAIFFNASASSFIKSDAAGTDLDISGFTNLDLNGLAITGAAGASFDGAVTINESGADVDFRVEGDNNANLLFCDASTDRIGIGTNSVDENLHIEDSSANADVHIKLQNDAQSVLLGIEGGDGDKGKLMYGTNDLIEFTADNFAIQPQASSSSTDVLTVRGLNASYTGDLVNIESARTSSSAFNFMSVVGDYDGSPTDIFYLRGDGNVGIGTSSPEVSLHLTSGTDSMFKMSADTNTGARTFIQFSNSDDTSAGNIQCNLETDTTTYNTSSDARVKNDRGAWDALSIIKNVPARKYERKALKGSIEFGFYAQELFKQVPQAVSRGGEDVNTNPWCVDYSQVTGVLWKAIQELSTEIDELKAKLAG